MKKSTSFVVGAIIGGGIAGFVGLVGGMYLPFGLADSVDNHCIVWRRVKEGKVIEDIYGNKSIFPELKKEETSE